ncbi:MAG: DUF5110 domain-containing protein [Bacteroidaceae bacterium]|nr:DUF5110 domain-containing protein [Bacteroidaceae bacterium]
MKKNLLPFAFALLGLLFTTTIQADNNPIADSDAMVVSGNMRFTVLTPQMIRIQYSPTSRFEDRATFGVVNRRLPVPAFTVENKDGYLYIRTSALTLRYKEGGKPSPSSKSDGVLRIAFEMNGQEVVWYPGKDDALNLRGTMRTLDNAAGDTKRNQLEKGILSRSGWAIIDESPSFTRGDGSRSFPMEPKEENGMDWVAAPIEANSFDWYFLGYGHDYKTALEDFVKIGGNIPLPPAYLFGYWYSRYWAYTSAEFMQIVKDIERYDIPLDVMILDMDWHTAGWTGWTWNKKLIPNPKGLLKWMHDHGLRTALNLHPADGVDNDEEYYDVLSRDLGRDPAAGETIPWELEDYEFYKAMFKDIIRVREGEGVDFWWLDWQQWLTNKNIEGLGQTFWHNHVFFEDMRLERPDRRPTIYHRWGGLGSHRYQIGFSGDTYATWPTLAYQPYFTATASNVGYGYWGHDLGGHQQSGTNDPELYLRWMQYGVFSPIFRTHATNASNIERRIWKFSNFEKLRETVILRYSLFPYIYTYAREAYDTGISICRPLYYEWPEENNAYSYEDEFLFGNEILVAPVLSPVNSEGLARRTVWLPEGDWFDVVRNTLVHGNCTFADDYTLDDIPYFYRAGSIIPNNPPQRSVMVHPSTLIFKIIPGADGSFVLYEDDGDNDKYKDGEFTRTRISQTRTDKSVDIQLSPREGSFAGMLEQRSYKFVLYGLTNAPTAVTNNGETIPSEDVSYDEATHTLTVTLHDIPCSSAVLIHVEAPTAAAVSYESLAVNRHYEPYSDATVTTGLWITGTAVPGGTQQLELYPDGTYRFHGTLLAGTLRIINTPQEQSSTRYIASRYVNTSVTTEGETYTRSTTSAADAEWVVPFSEDRYRFTVNTKRNTFYGELFIPFGELYIIGGCMAENQADKWHIENAQPFTRSESNPNVWYWTGHLRNIPGNIESRRFKLVAQKDWGPRALHPFTQDEPLISSTRASEVSDDNKWAVTKDGWYTLTVDMFRETIHADYLGSDYEIPSSASMHEEPSSSDYDIAYNLNGQPICVPQMGIQILAGKKIFIR